MLTHGIHPMASLYDALSSLQFLNAGTTLATDQFFWENIRPVGESQVMVYLEADNVSCVECAWPDGGRVRREKVVRRLSLSIAASYPHDLQISPSPIHRARSTSSLTRTCGRRTRAG